MLPTVIALRSSMCTLTKGRPLWGAKGDYYGTVLFQPQCCPQCFVLLSWGQGRGFSGAEFSMRQPLSTVMAMVLAILLCTSQYNLAVSHSQH